MSVPNLMPCVTSSGSLTIRPLTVDELPWCVESGQAFYREMALPGRFIPAVFLATWGRYYALEMGIVIAALRDEQVLGVIGGLCFHDQNDGRLCVAEVFWFLHQAARQGRTGLRLLAALEDWAREIGAGEILMMCLMGYQEDRLGQLYIHQGYAPLEVVYRKALT